jgi:hypothetical protein
MTAFDPLRSFGEAGMLRPMDSTLKLYRALRWLQLLLAFAMGAWGIWSLASGHRGGEASLFALLSFAILSIGIEAFRQKRGLAFTWSGVEPNRND